jgi:hypothetical protein
VIDAPDSFSEAVRARILAVNPARNVVGVIDASEWPPAKVSMESFYCLLLAITPSGGRPAFTPSAPMYSYRLQWVWVIAGTDIQPTQQQANRGDRYRTHLAMCEELRVGLFPNFGEKLHFSLDQTSGNIVGTSLNPQEFIWWSPGAFRHRVDKVAGLLYGFVDVSLNSWSALISA